MWFSWVTNVIKTSTKYRLHIFIVNHCLMGFDFVGGYD